jgi:hypothetical protein
MGKATGFLEFERTDRGYIKPEEYLEYLSEQPVDIDMNKMEIIKMEKK